MFLWIDPTLVDMPRLNAIRKRSAYRLLWLGALVACVITSSVGSAQQSDPNDRLSRYLDRLGLPDLQMRHLEEVLDVSEGETRENTARRLSDLYAANLMRWADDREKYQSTLARINRLVEKVPAAKTPSLEVMLLQADYNRAETLIGKWQFDPNDTKAKNEAIEILMRITPELDNFETSLTAEVKTLDEKLNRIDDDDEADQVQKEADRTRAIAGQAGYFSAWSHYYLRLLNVGTDADVAKARQLFQKILGIEGSYSEYDAGSLALSSIWRARSLVGLGLTQALAGNVQARDTCFKWLEDESVPTVIRDLVPYFRLESFVNAGQIGDALDFARDFIGKASATASQGKVTFFVSLVRIAYSGQATPAQARELANLGIRGLIELKQQAAVKQLVQKYNIELTDESGFYLKWIKGQQLYDKAVKTKAEEDFQAAATALQSALDAPDSKQDLTSTANCQNQLAMCYYRLGKQEQAARLFEQAATGLNASGSREAVEAAWRAFVSYHSLARDQKRFATSAIDVLQQIKRDYPGHKYAKLADYHIGKLQQNAVSTEETLATLEKVQPGSEHYLSAKYDICTLLHKQWSGAKAADKPGIASKLQKAVDDYVRAARDEDARKARCCLMMVEVATGSDPPNTGLASEYLQKSAAFARSLSADAPAVVEYRYRSLLAALVSGDKSAQRQHALWFVENGQGSRFERVALIRSAQVIEAEIKNASGKELKSLQESAYQAYVRLAEALGGSADRLASSKNARVATSKAAHFAQETGRYAESAQLVELLMAAAPEKKDRNYLRRAGLARYENGDFDQALELFRTLLAGTKKGSDPWFEAKFYQLSCLRRLSPDKFQQVWNQFRLLYPDLGSEKWRERFEELQKT